MLTTEITLFAAVVVLFMLGWALSKYLHDKYWMFKQQTMGLIPKLTFIAQLIITAVLYLAIIYMVFRDDRKGKLTIILRFLILFATNIILFALIYFILYLFNNQEYGKADENVVVASTLQGRYIQMVYLSIVTFFTVGYSNIIPFGVMSRIVNIIQILTAYIISAYLYSRAALLFNIN